MAAGEVLEDGTIVTTYFGRLRPIGNGEIWILSENVPKAEAHGWRESGERSEDGELARVKRL